MPELTNETGGSTREAKQIIQLSLNSVRVQSNKIQAGIFHRSNRNRTNPKSSYIDGKQTF